MWSLWSHLGAKRGWDWGGEGTILQSCHKIHCHTHERLSKDVVIVHGRGWGWGEKAQSYNHVIRYIRLHSAHPRATIVLFCPRTCHSPSPRTIRLYTPAGQKKGMCLAASNNRPHEYLYIALNTAGLVKCQYIDSCFMKSLPSSFYLFPVSCLLQLFLSWLLGFMFHRGTIRAPPRFPIP